MESFLNTYAVKHFTCLQTEQVRIAVMLYTCIRQRLGSHLGLDINHPDQLFRSFSQSPKDKYLDTT
jgi:hypothetical protein